MIQKELSKAIVFLMIATMFFWFAGTHGFYGHSRDNIVHQKMANLSMKEYEPTYAPLFRSVSWLFSKSDSTWVFWIMFLFAFLTPLLLVYITKSWWAALFYFAITNQFYWVIQGGFTQGLLLIFVLALFAIKDNRIRIPVFVLGLASHSTAPLLLSFVFLVILLNENWVMIYAHLKRFRNAVLGCSALLGQNVDSNSVLNQGINATKFNGQVNGWWEAITPWSLLTLLLKICPVFFAFPAFQKLYQLKRFDLLALVVIGLIASLEFGTRTWYLLFIPLVIGFTLYFNSIKSSSQKRIWFAFVLLYLFFQLCMWVNFNLNC